MGGHSGNSVVYRLYHGVDYAPVIAVPVLVERKPTGVPGNLPDEGRLHPQGPPDDLARAVVPVAGLDLVSTADSAGECPAGLGISLGGWQIGLDAVVGRIP